MKKTIASLLLFLQATQALAVGQAATQVKADKIKQSSGGVVTVPNLTGLMDVKSYATTATAGGTTTLASTSQRIQFFTGASTQSVVLPAANTLANTGDQFELHNNSTGIVTVKDNGSNTLYAIPGCPSAPCPATIFTVTNIGSANGTWDTATGGGVTQLTTKGDVLTYSTSPTRQAVPGDYGNLVPDSGATTGWRSNTYSQVNNGGINKDYVQYADFENNATTGWTATGCATVTNGLCVSVGSGGAAFSSSNGGRTKGANTNAPAINSGSSVSGTYSLNLATTGAGVIGDGYVSSLLPIDPSDAAKVLTYKFNFKVASGTPVMGGTSTDTYAVAIYSPADNAWLSATPSFAITQGTGVGTAQGSFQTNSTTTSVQIFVYSPVAPTGTSSLLLDDFYIGPAARTYGAVQTDWVAYTPTFNNLGTVTSPSFFSRRIGDTLYVRGVLTLGTTAASNANISLGYNGGNSNVTIDTTKILNGTSLVGTMTSTQASATTFGWTVLAAGANSFLNLGIQSSTLNGQTLTTGTNLGSTGQTWSLFAAVPIVGWSSNVQASSDADTRVVAARATGNPASATSGNPIIFPTVTFDTHGAYSGITGLYTCPVPGYYKISGYMETSATSANIYVYKNSVQGDSVIGGASALYWPVNSGSILCNAGDTLSLRPNATFDAANIGYIAFERLSGPAQIAASEKVRLKYTNTAGTSITSSAATVPFATKSYDSHSAFNGATGVFTAPRADTYRITTGFVVQAVSNSTSQFLDLYFLVTSTPEGLSAVAQEVNFIYGEGVSHVRAIGASRTYQLNQGDTIAVQLANSNTIGLATTAGVNSVSIESQGGI